jgi:transaldolase
MTRPPTAGHCGVTNRNRDRRAYATVRVPGATLEAFADRGQVSGGIVTGGCDGGRGFLDQLAAAGVDFDDVTGYLEGGGLATFGKGGSGPGAAVAAGMDRRRA